MNKSEARGHAVEECPTCDGEGSGQKRWTVRTTRGGFIVYAATAAAAKGKMTRQGHVVREVRPRGYLAGDGE
jgi:hypothetical protein